MKMGVILSGAISYLCLSHGQVNYSHSFSSSSSGKSKNFTRTAKLSGQFSYAGSTYKQTIRDDDLFETKGIDPFSEGFDHRMLITKAKVAAQKIDPGEQFDVTKYSIEPLSGKDVWFAKVSLKKKNAKTPDNMPMFADHLNLSSITIAVTLKGKTGEFVRLNEEKLD